MVVYNIPALSGVRFSLDQINELVTIPRVCALKQTSGDLFQMEQTKGIIQSLCYIMVTMKYLHQG